MGLGERFSGATDDHVHGAGGELGTKQLAQKFSGVAAGDTVADGKRGYGRLQARAEGLPGNVARQLGPRFFGAL